MTDRFETHALGLTSPATRAFAITPQDGSDLSQSVRALNVAVSGQVRVTTVEGDTADIHIAAGLAFPIRARRVHASGTTATGIVGLH